jgi:homoserine kinase
MSAHISSQFQEVIESIEALPRDDQEILVEIIRHRLIQERRKELIKEVAEARQAYQSGDVQRGTVDDLMKELTE